MGKLLKRIIYKLKPFREDVICSRCKQPGHYLSYCTEATDLSNEHQTSKRASPAPTQKPNTSREESHE